MKRQPQDKITHNSILVCSAQALNDAIKNVLEKNNAYNPYNLFCSWSLGPIGAPSENRDPASPCVLW